MEHRVLCRLSHNSLVISYRKSPNEIDALFIHIFEFFPSYIIKIFHQIKLVCYVIMLAVVEFIHNFLTLFKNLRFN